MTLQISPVRSPEDRVADLGSIDLSGIDGRQLRRSKFAGRFAEDGITLSLVHLDVALAVNPIGDRHLLHPEIFGNQRRKSRHRPAGGTGKDRPQRLRLLVVSALIDIGGHRPIPICHRAGRMNGKRDIEMHEG